MAQASPAPSGRLDLPLRVFIGPNPFASSPVVVTVFDEAGLRNADPARIERRLRQAYGSWQVDRAALDGLPQRLALATLAAHWARGLLNSVRGLIEGAGAAATETDRVLWWVGYHVPQTTLRAMTLTLALLEAAAATADEEFPPAALHQQVERLQRACRRDHPDYLARVLMLAARADGLPIRPAATGPRHWQYGWGCRSRVFHETTPHSEGVLGHRLAGDKVLTHRFLRRLGIPTTEQRLADNVEEAHAQAARLGWPLVVKPADKGQGRGVTVGVDSADRLATAFAEARRLSARPIILERVVPGGEHRLLVVRGRLVAASCRHPPSVLGDGRHSITELVEQLNQQRAADPIQARYLRVVRIDQATTRYLAAQRLDAHSVPAAGQRVLLRGNSNISTGGWATNVMPRLHPEIRAMAESVALNAGLECVGVDYLSEDIGRSWREVGGAVIEFNTHAGLDPHIVDGAYTEEALGRLLLGDGLGRVPVVVAIGPPSRQRQWVQAVEAHRHALPAGVATVGPEGMRLGCAGSGGLFIDADGRPVDERAAQALTHRQCTALLLTTSAAEIAARGFPLDRCSLAVWHADPDATSTELALRISRSCADQLRVADDTAAGLSPALLERVLSRLAST